jgi:hypothetical protein
MSHDLYCIVLYKIWYFYIAFLSTLFDWYIQIVIFVGSAVSLLLDQGFKSKQSCYFHPLSNDVTIGMIQYKTS